jgi:hypothetical protein
MAHSPKPFLRPSERPGMSRSVASSTFWASNPNTYPHPKSALATGRHLISSSPPITRRWPICRKGNRSPQFVRRPMQSPSSSNTSWTGAMNTVPRTPTNGTAGGFSRAGQTCESSWPAGSAGRAQRRRPGQRRDPRVALPACRQRPPGFGRRPRPRPKAWPWAGWYQSGYCNTGAPWLQQYLRKLAPIDSPDRP